MLGEQHYGISHPAHQVADLEARAQRQQRELARAVIERSMHPGPGDDVHALRRGIDGDQHRRARIVQAGVHGLHGLAAIREFTYVHSEFVSAYVARDLHEPLDLLASIPGQFVHRRTVESPVSPSGGLPAR